MARFYDRIRRDDKEVDPELRQLLNGAMVIDGTSLSDYLYQNDSKGEWDLVQDYFNLAPPFEKFWVECRAPKTLMTGFGKAPWPNQLPQEWGVLFTATDISNLPDDQRMALLGGPYAKDDPCYDEIMDVNERIRWVLQAILFAPNPPQGRPNPGVLREQFTWWFSVLPDGSQPTSSPRQRHIKFEYVCDERLGQKAPTVTKHEDGTEFATFDEAMLNLGNIRHVDSGTRFWYPTNQVIKLNERRDDLYENLQGGTTDNFIKAMSLADDIPSMSPGWQAHYTAVEEYYWLPLLQPCLMTICWMHVKNVKLESHEPSAPVLKRAVKRHGEPPCKYYTLQITPFRQILEREGASTQTGLHKALHLCRGHFHHYGIEHKGEQKGLLFGKYKGTFWVPAHLRGSVERGLIDKVYKVQTPKTQEGKLDFEVIEDVTERYRAG